MTQLCAITRRRRSASVCEVLALAWRSSQITPRTNSAAVMAHVSNGLWHYLVDSPVGKGNPDPRVADWPLLDDFMVRASLQTPKNAGVSRVMSSDKIFLSVLARHPHRNGIGTHCL